jgi:RHS repeat-associated protein
VLTLIALLVQSGRLAGQSTLVAAWSFNEGTGTTSDDRSTNDHTASLSGPAWTTGKYGGGLSFDGVDDVVSVADANDLDFSSAFTIEAWVRPDVSAAVRPLVRKGAMSGFAYSLSLTTDTKPKAEVVIGGTTYSVTGSSVLADTTFDPWGRRSVVTGADITNGAFTNHRAHEPSRTALTMYRAYDADLARWLGQDPIGLKGGLNKYAYVGNNPTRNVDRLGLKITCSSGVVEHLNEPSTPCGTGGCTQAMFQFEASPCVQEACSSRWKFDGAVLVRVEVWFAQDPSLQHSPGKTLRQHEYDHVGDYTGWCRAAESPQSEGFPSLAACNLAREGWLAWVRQSYDDFDRISANRDR